MHRVKSNKKSTIAAAKAQIKRDLKQPAPPPQSTQGSLTDRHVRQHTPDSFDEEPSSS